MAQAEAALVATQEGGGPKAKGKNQGQKSGIAGLAGKLATRNSSRAAAGLAASPGQAAPAGVEASPENKGKKPLSSLDAIKALLAASKTSKAEAPDRAAIKKIGPGEEQKTLDPSQAKPADLSALNHVPERKLEAKAKKAGDSADSSALLALAGKPGQAPKATEAEAKEAKVLVTDLRKAPKAKDEASGQSQDVSAIAAKAEKSPASSKEVTLDLDATKGVQALRQDAPASQSPDQGGLRAERAPAKDFTSVLAEQLKAAGNTDIVQSAQLILKDGDAGTIRLRLHPDSLGGVKIELRLADNSISGKIIVESDEAKSAFERNMASLNDAFKQSGFESSRLEVQVGSGNQGQQGKQGQDGPAPFWSQRHGRETLAQAVPEALPESRAAKARGAVNLLA